MTAVVGAAHDAGVERLLASYRAIPPGSAVRLAKPTSNLFRARGQAHAPGLDTSGLTGVIAVDPEARTADVAGMCTYEDLVAATLPYGLAPLVVPQLQDHHPRRCGHRARHRVGVVPQRPAARVGARDGHPHRRRRGRHRASPSAARRSVPRLPQFLWHARLRGPAADRARAGRAVRRAAAPALPRRSTTLVDAMDRIVDDRRPTTASRSTTSTAWCSAPTRVLPRASGAQTDEPGPVSDYTGQQIYYRSIQHDAGDRSATGSPSTTTCGAGTPTGSGARGRSARRTRGSGGSGRGAAGAAASTGSSIALRPAVRHRRPPRDAQRPAAARTGRAGRRGADRARPPSSCDWFLRERADRADLAVPVAAARATQRVAAVPAAAGPAPTSTSASGRRCRSARRAEGATNRLIERKVSDARRAQVAVLRRRSTTRRSSTSSTAASTTPCSRSATTPTRDCSTCTRRRCRRR